MNKAILDASALLALLNKEPGAEIVAGVIPYAVMSAINLSEVIAKLNRAGMPENSLRQVLESLDLEIIPFDAEQAYLTGLLQTKTRTAGLSLGDRACLSLGKILNLTVLTADKSWAGLSTGTVVRVIR